MKHVGQALQHHRIRVGKHKINGHEFHPLQGFTQAKRMFPTGNTSPDLGIQNRARRLAL
jgi:hypothetical protein